MHDDEIKRLIKILEESSIDELEVSDFWGQKKIRLKKNSYIKTEYPVNNVLYALATCTGVVVIAP